LDWSSPYAHLFRRVANVGKLIHLLFGVAIAGHGSSDAPSVVRDPAITDISRPRMDRMRDGVHLLGVTCTHRDGVGTLEIAIDFIVAIEAVAAPQRQDGEHYQVAFGHLSILN
jgi:hypothetical protein